MKKILSCAIFASLFSFNVAIGDGHEMAPGAVANFVNPEGDVIGDAKLWQGRTGVVIEVQLSGLGARQACDSCSQHWNLRTGFQSIRRDTLMSWKAHTES